MIYQHLNDLNRLNITMKEGRQVRKEIEESIRKTIRENGILLSISGEALGNGGRHTGNNAVNRKEHLLGRLYQHHAGHRLEPDKRQYHRHSIIDVLRELEESYPEECYL